MHHDQGPQVLPAGFFLALADPVVAASIRSRIGISGSKARQDQIALAAGFATLGEANNRNKKLLEDLLRRLHGGREDNDGTLGFQIAA